MGGRAALYGSWGEVSRSSPICSSLFPSRLVSASLHAHAHTHLALIAKTLRKNKPTRGNRYLNVVCHGTKTRRELLIILRSPVGPLLCIACNTTPSRWIMDPVKASNVSEGLEVATLLAHWPAKLAGASFLLYSSAFIWPNQTPSLQKNIITHAYTCCSASGQMADVSVLKWQKWCFAFEFVDLLFKKRVFYRIHVFFLIFF